MAINLTAQTAPIAFVRATLHATPGNLEVLTIPTWCKVITIRAAGSGDVKISHTGAQDAAITSTAYVTIPNGYSLVLKAVQLAGFPLRLTGTVSSDPVEIILESALGA